MPENVTSSHALGSEAEGWHDSEAGITSIPSVRMMDQIALMSIVHGEGPQRLQTLLQWVRPWFAHVILGMQGPTDEEYAIAQSFDCVIVEDEVHGFPAPTFDKVMREVRAYGSEWAFWVSGDELPDQTLMASLPMAIARPEITRALGARVPIRNTWELSTGQILPGWNEINERLLYKTISFPPRMHAHALGTRTRPPAWTEYGAIRQHRTVSEFLKAYVWKLQQSDVYASSVSAQYVLTLEELLTRALGRERAHAEFARHLSLAEIDFLSKKLTEYADPLSTWKVGANA